MTRHGRIEVDWHVDDDGTLAVDVTVPDGVTAEVDLPGTDVRRLGGGTHRVTAPAATSAAAARG
jgi:alpha-L-rhamnosidase